MRRTHFTGREKQCSNPELHFILVSGAHEPSTQLEV